MNEWFKIIGFLLIASVTYGQSGGQSGATQLLINPWGKSSGVGGADAAYGKGIEMVYMNPAGIAGIEKTDLLFSRSNWLQGSEIFINTFGVAQRFNDRSVIGLSVMSFNLGNIEITTVDNPEGGIGTYRPQFVNGGLTYGRKFSNNIDGGITLKLISEGIHNVSAFGMALDAGVKYVSGKGLNGKTIDVRDPMADDFVRIARTSNTSEYYVESILNINEVFPENLRNSAFFRKEIQNSYKFLEHYGSLGAIKKLMGVLEK